MIGQLATTPQKPA